MDTAWSGLWPSVSSLTRLTAQTERCWSGIEEEELEADPGTGDGSRGEMLDPRLPRRGDGVDA